LIFAKCDYTFTDITDLNEWDTAITANEIHSSGEILAQKPKGSFEKQRYASCIPERSVNGTKSITLKDYNADPTFGEFDFWNGVIADQDTLVFGFIDCEDNFYGWFEDWSLELDNVIPETTEEANYFDGSIEFEELTMTKPQLITGLNDHLA